MSEREIEEVEDIHLVCGVCGVTAVALHADERTCPLHGDGHLMTPIEYENQPKVKCGVCAGAGYFFRNPPMSMERERVECTHCGGDGKISQAKAEYFG